MTFSVLGNDPQGNPVSLKQADRRQGLYIVGGTGQGKTGLIENLIVQDIKQGLGVAVLDPHGDLTNAVLARIPEERIQDIILLDIADEEHPFGLNLFTCDNPKSAVAVQYVVDQVMHIFEKLFEVSRGETPLLLDYLRNCAYALIANPGFTMADIPLLFMNKACRQKLLTNVKDSDVKLFWQQYDEMKPNEQREESASTLRRVREFLQPLARQIVGQAQSTINLRAIMDERKILLITLDARLPSVTSLIGSVFIALLLNAAYSRADLEQKRRKQFNIYADEFQRFATEDMAILLTEARKFGIATTIAHQTLSQISEKNKAAASQAGNLVVFRVTGADSQELASSFDCTPPPAETRPEEIRTPVSDVLGFLKTRGGSTNPFINEFVSRYNLLAAPEYGFLFSRANRGVSLERLIQTEEEKTLFFTMVREQVYLAVKDRLTFPFSMFQWDKQIYSIAFDKEQTEEETEFYRKAQFYPCAYQYFQFGLPAWSRHWNVAFMEQYKKASDSEQYRLGKQEYEIQKDPTRELLYALFVASGNPNGSAFQQASLKLEQFIRPMFTQFRTYNQEVVILAVINQINNFSYSRHMGVKNNILYRKDVHVPNPAKEFEQAIPFLHDVSSALGKFADDKCNPRSWWSKEKLVDFAKAKRLLQQEIDDQISQQKLLIEQFMIDLYKVLRLLKDDPIVSGSGTYQSIPGSQRTYQDMQNEIASRLANLPKYTAHVKVSHDERTIESTIKTTEPEHGIGRRKLEERKQQIKEQNILSGYLKASETVEEEISTRQSACQGTLSPQERFRPERDV